jgi:hypothetical protein
MNAPLDPEAAAELAAALLDLFKNLGRAWNLELYRVALSRDGRGEAEFLAPNPVECLVLKWDDPLELQELAARAGQGDALPDRAVYRKKCTRCLLHERPLA